MKKKLSPSSPAPAPSMGVADMGSKAHPPAFDLEASSTQAPEAVTADPDLSKIVADLNTALKVESPSLETVLKTLEAVKGNNDQIAELKRLYLSTHNKTLESEIMADFKGEDLVKCQTLLGRAAGEERTWGKTAEVSNAVSEKIENAPEGLEAWNGTFSWQSKYQLYFNHDQEELIVRLRLKSAASPEVQSAWDSAVESKWSSNSLEVEFDEETKKTYDIKMQVDWVESDEHYEVTPNAPDADLDGRAGLGGTTSMTDWGTEDTVDITHEVGHMLGAVEDYFTTDGHDHTHGGTRRGYRDEGGGIMNNPEEDPFANHFESIRKEAAQALGLDASKCTVK